VSEGFDMSPAAERPSLHAKLLNIAKQIDYLEKRGRNENNKYDYVQSVDVLGKLRRLLFDAGILVVPAAHKPEHLQFSSRSGSPSFLTSVELVYRFVDTETSESIAVPWVGCGVDTGGDKGIYKAFTGALKYMLLSTFLVPTSNDPERDELTEPEPVQQTETRAAAPRIPMDRAEKILAEAEECGLADRKDGVKLSVVFQAKLADVGATKIGNLNVDQAEDVEKFLREEKAVCE
jgi:ERF superfamily